MIFNMSTGGSSTADKVKYNNTESGLKSTDVQGAIDEVNSSLTPKNIFSASFVNLSNYITEDWQEFEAPYSGWYWMYCSTGGQSEINCFVRLGISNGYVYSVTGQKGVYNYITSPLIYIKKGKKMVAQTEHGLKITSILYCHIDE